jgi:hypothetical protein
VSSNPVDLDTRRGMAAQKATGLRRLLAEVESNEKQVRDRQIELESHLVAVPATSWDEAAAKARYVLNLYAASLSAHNTQQRELVAAVLADFARLSEED